MHITNASPATPISHSVYQSVNHLSVRYIVCNMYTCMCVYIQLCLLLHYLWKPSANKPKISKRRRIAHTPRDPLSKLITAVSATYLPMWIHTHTNHQSIDMRWGWERACARGKLKEMVRLYPTKNKKREVEEGKENKTLLLADNLANLCDMSAGEANHKKLTEWALTHWRTDAWIDGQAGRRTDRRTDERTDRCSAW